MTPAKSWREKELDAKVVAHLLEQRCQQREIALTLGLSEADVTRLKSLAKRQGWLMEGSRYALSDGIKDNAEAMREIKARITPGELTRLMEKLATRNGRTVSPQIRVFSTLYSGTTVQAWKGRLADFSRAAAGYLRDLLLSSKGITGVSWGNTLAEVVKAVSDMSVPSKRSPEPIQFIPLCGEPLGGFPTRFSSSILAAQLDAVFNRRSDHSLSLPVPALYPRDLTTKEIGTLRRLNRYVEGYRRVFGESANGSDNESPLIARVDTILTSVGHPDIAYRFGADDQFLKSAGFEREEVSGILIGDIGGVPLPRLGLDRSKRAVLNAIRERWTGVKEDHLRACAEKSSRDGSCGTIVVAIGKNKAATVHESFRRGLVNHLVIDQELADELESLGDDPNTVVCTPKTPPK